jgi:Zn-dependent protease
LERIELCIIWYAVFVFSIVCHEAAHSLAALRFGDRTAWQHGLVTLNPIPHIQRSPLGMLLIPLMSFAGNGWMIGWASAPYDPYWAQQYPRRAAWMALAGPGANLALAILAGALIHLGIKIGFFNLPETIRMDTVVEGYRDGLPAGVAVMISVLFSLNTLLLVFNLIPIAPLDGTALAEFILKGQTLYQYRALMAHPNVRFIGLFVAWYIMGEIYWPIRLATINLLFLPYGVSYG